jgi:hypothetical protein
VELSWSTKVRIAGSVAVGVLFVGFIGWPLVAPSEPGGAVLMVVGGGAATLLGLAFFCGFAAYFVSWPEGREIGILAVPSGLAVWALRSGNMAGLLQSNPGSVSYRESVFESIRWEPVFWLAVVGAGFAGVLLGQMVRQPKVEAEKNIEEGKTKAGLYSKVVMALASLVISVLVAQVLMGILAQDVRIWDSKVGFVVGQPAIGQIVFAVLVSFGMSGFVVKRFLGTSYVWPVVASALVTGVSVTVLMRKGLLEHVASRYPAIFFANGILAILPVQIVAFGVLGSVAGYWAAIRYDYWREHELG